VACALGAVTEKLQLPTRIQRIDLNCDLGESFGAYTIGNDISVMENITSANIACGAHAGDPSIMRTTVRLAQRSTVAVGAHPGFPDLVGFGRREIKTEPREVEDFVLAQVGALDGVARAEGTRLHHVKPHGALYSMAARNRALADAIARAVVSLDPSLILYGLSGSCLLDAGRAVGLAVASEVFADRAYGADGVLIPRGQPGAVVSGTTQVVDRALQMVLEGTVTTVSGERIALVADTICVHGDTLGVVDLVGHLRLGFKDAGVTVAAVGSSV